jgi:hypothetical protein
MESTKPVHRPVVHTSAQPDMSIKDYVELVDRLLEDKHFQPELKKPLQKSGF